MVLTRFRSSKPSTETNQKELKSDVRRAPIAPAADGDRPQGSSRPEKRSENVHIVSSRGVSKGRASDITDINTRSSRPEGRREEANLLPPRHEARQDHGPLPSMNPGRPFHMERSSASREDDLPKLLRDLPNYSFTSNSDSVRMMNSCSTSTTSINSLPEAFRGATPNQSFTSHSSGASSCWEGHIANNFFKHNSNIDIDGVLMAQQGERSSDQQQQQQQQQQENAAAVISSICVASRINMLVSSLGSDHVEVRRNALTELRLLAKHDDDRRVAIFHAGAADALVQLLYSDDVMSQQEATTTLLNLSLNQHIKAGLIESGVIDPLVRVIRLGLTPTSTEHAAVALGNLVRKDEKLKARVGELGAISPLLELLYGGSERGKKDAAMALYILSSLDENKRRMVRGGATRILLHFLSKDASVEGMMGKSIAILKNLVSIEEGRVAFVEEGGLKLLFGIIQGGTRETQEFSLGILMELCRHSSKHATLVLKMDPLPSLESMSNSACVHLKSKASELINILEEHKLSPMKQLNWSRHS